MTLTLQMKIIYFLPVLIASFCSRADCTGHGGNEVSCTTSKDQSGNCIAVRQCKYAMDIIKEKGIVSKQAQNFLLSNQCGFEGYDVKVCCFQGKNSAGVRNTNGQQADSNQNSNNKFKNNWNSQTTISNWDINNSDPQTTANNWNDNWNHQTTTSKPKYVNPLLLLPRDCGLDESNRIIGGEKTTLGEFPWMAVLEYRQDRQAKTAFGCGGVLISKRYVLTAAHCILAIPSYLQLSNVRLGEYDLRNNPDCVNDGSGRRTCADPMISVPIERQIVHQNYSRPEAYRNDIALLRLAYEVEFTKFVKPICLPTYSDTSSSYWSAGWGAIENRRSSDIKLKVSLPYVESIHCAFKYSTKNVILGSGQMCAGGKAGKDTCRGDSGGPLMKQVPTTSGLNRWVVDGVLSIGHTPCGMKDWPGVYTKVHNYVRWIASHLEP